MTTKTYKRIHIVRLSTSESRVMLKELKTKYLDKFTAGQIIALGFMIAFLIQILVQGLTG